MTFRKGKSKKRDAFFFDTCLIFPPLFSFNIIEKRKKGAISPLSQRKSIYLQTDLEYRIDMKKEKNFSETDFSKKKGRITPRWIDSLKENEIFVFGSNLAGMHGGGAARIARLHFDAVMGKGVGLQGQSYAIPTMQGGVETIRPYVEEFLDFANHHPELHFLVTPIGCGIAGFEAEDIAPLFESAKEMKNISLPESFWEVIE